MKFQTKFLLLFLVVVASLNSKAQENKINFELKRNTNKNIDFSFEKADPGTYTVIANLKDLINTYAAAQQVITIKNYSGNVLTLTPINKEQNINLSTYGFSYIRGKLNPKYDSNFLYLLPYQKGIKVRAVEVGFVGARYFGNETPADWKVYRFYTTDQDTVTTIRKGIVVNVVDTYENDETGTIAFSNKANEIIIEHTDGTLATYKGFKKGSTAVKVGQTVFPGSALGVNSKGSNGRYNISIAITYLKSSDMEGNKGQNLKNSKSMYGFITPYFATAENGNLILENQKEYTAVLNMEVMQKEMTKKEIKSVGIK